MWCGSLKQGCSSSVVFAVWALFKILRVASTVVALGMKEVYGEQCLAPTFLWCKRYEAGRVNIKDLPRPGQEHVVTNSATISAVDELIRHT
ncbi:hypothetical protein AVEN_171707-1 [Araneus ventricosus]|uniref:Uncharacterized protein n=1 Tax=Araneus ventricosus TaxID=182803 RepID=A0A4Y2VEG2_ARAVE|nr:hypothetical protein AVEN_52185-1 [Araneus ventricosus]GBO23677.1 hypothetical protein AVEN_171707-1 [Araneus ventricosus]